MSSIQGKEGPKDVTVDQNGTYWIKMGETSRFGRALQCSMDHSKRVLLKEFLRTWEVIEDGKIKVQVWGKKIVSDWYSFMNNLHFL